MNKSSTTSEHSQSSAPSHMQWTIEPTATHPSIAIVQKWRIANEDVFYVSQIKSEAENLQAILNSHSLILEACKEALDVLSDQFHAEDGPTGNRLRAAINAAQGNSGSGDLK